MEKLSVGDYYPAASSLELLTLLKAEFWNKKNPNSHPLPPILFEEAKEESAVINGS